MEITGKLHKGVTGEIEWEIDYFSLSKEMGKCYHSSEFTFDGESWFLRIYPYRPSFLSGTQYIGVFLCRKVCGPPISLTWSFWLKTIDGVKYNEKQYIYTFEKINMDYGSNAFLKTSELSGKKSELMPSGILTIVCSLKGSIQDTVSTSHGKISKDETREKDSTNNEDESQRKGVLTEDKGINKLLENFRQIFFHGRLSDVVLKLDGREFNAHKMVLIAQSPVFASMFQHDLAEKNDNVVNIPDCTPESFEVFLHYLYCGRPENMSKSNVYNVYYAADKYQVDELKEKCIEFMINNISIETFCDVIALSLRHGESELQKTATDFFCQNVKKIIKTVEWQKYLDENSTHANELFIKALNAC